MGTIVHIEDGKNAFAFLNDQKQNGIWWGAPSQDEIDPDRIYDADYIRELAGCDFRVEQADLLFTPVDSNGNEMDPVKYKNRKINYCSDNQMPVGIVSENKYHVVQPAR